MPLLCDAVETFLFPGGCSPPAGFLVALMVSVNPGDDDEDDGGQGKEGGNIDPDDDEGYDDEDDEDDDEEPLRVAPRPRDRRPGCCGAPIR